jgi:fluoride exporter
MGSRSSFDPLEAQVYLRRSGAAGKRTALLITYLWIALGGALGSMARYGCSSLVARWIGETFPWGTLIINVLGSFVIGFFATLTGPDGRLIVAPDARQFVMVGICGGYTTFSSFSLQTLNLAREGDLMAAGANIAASVVACLVAVWLGAVGAAALNQAAGR